MIFFSNFLSFDHNSTFSQDVCGIALSRRAKGDEKVEHGQRPANPVTHISRSPQRK